jgi:hypothetical protein
MDEEERERSWGTGKPACVINQYEVYGWRGANKGSCGTVRFFGARTLAAIISCTAACTACATLNPNLHLTYE